MKIAVIGSECSGKTSLAVGVAANLGLDVLPNPNEALLEATGYHTLFEWGAATNDWEGWLERQAARERTFERGVVDHGVIDHYCFIQRWAWNQLSPDRTERLRNLVVDAAARYTHILITAPRIVAPHAPWRFRNANAAIQMARLARSLVREIGAEARALELPAVELPALLSQATGFVRR